jgi:UDP-N-acetyl-D-glucosamine dehydrogenase
MPRYVVARVLDALNDRGKTLKGNKVLVLGVAYKPDIEDVRESPAFDVIALMRKKGAWVEYHDPFVPHIRHEHEGWKMDSITDGDLMKKVAEADAVVIITDHKSYDYKSILEKAQFIFDSRNALGKLNTENLKVVRL